MLDYMYRGFMQEVLYRSQMCGDLVGLKIACLQRDHILIG
jgi:hypothetical protein